MGLSSQKSQGGNFAKSEKDRKIGHRRVDDAGQVTYKKVRETCFLHCISIALH